MRYVEAKKCEVIPIGRQGENEVETVQFDVSGWAEEYGNGTFTLLHQRSRDTAPYECPIEVDGETVNWAVRNTDTAYGGLGEAQLIYTVNEAVAKSVIFETKTHNSLDGDVVLPDPYDDWLREIHEDTEFTRENMDKVVQAEEYAEIAEEKAREASEFVGSPLVASLENEMTDHDKVYVYVGNEVGMNNGDWYYWNGTTWVDGGVYNSVAVDTDTTLSIAGKAADAKAVGDKFSVEDTKVNVLHSIINYGYDTPQHRNPDPTSSNSEKIGFDRDNNIIVLNGGGLSSDAIRIKVNGTIATTISSNTIKTWAATVLLESGRKYRSTVKLLSGAIAPVDESGEMSVKGCISLSIYQSGTSTSVGNLYYSGDKKSAYRIVDGDGNLYNLVLYIETGVSFTNAKFFVSLEDITEKRVSSDLEDFDYFDEKINYLHKFIDYGYDHDKVIIAASGSSSDGTSVGVERCGTRIKLNYAGSSSSSANKRVRISGAIERKSGGSTYKQWVGNLQLTEGKEYYIKIRKLSGTCTVSSANYIPTPNVYKANGVDITTAISSDSMEVLRKFTAPSEKVTVAIYLPYNAITTDFVCDVSIWEYENDLPIADYYISEMSDTVAKVRNEVTSPSLVFMWATDIHRHSSNANGIQTFGNMIANMNMLAKEVPCDFILDTGDLTDGNTIQATTLSRAYTCLKDFRSIGVPYIWSQGNHDNNYAVSGSPYLFTIQECFKAYFSALKGNYNVNENGTEYYIDYDELNTRLISLNANNCTNNVEYAYGQSTAMWLTNALDTDKKVIVVAHQSPYSEQVYNNQSTSNASGIRTALETFVNNGGSLFMMSGHSHADVAYVSPFLSIMQSCQRFSSIAEDITEEDHGMTGFIDVVRFPAREQGTATEDCWSVGVYKPDSNELSLIRFGAGKDRYFHVTPIAPTTATTKLTGTIAWSSSDESIATVSDGIITGVATGRCAVLAKDEFGNYECWIVVVS